jgi:hypothetical protein
MAPGWRAAYVRSRTYTREQQSARPQRGRVEIDGIHVAYLSHESAEEYRGYMNTARCRIHVHLVQGGREGTVGVFTGRSATDNETLRRKRTA